MAHLPYPLEVPSSLRASKGASRWGAGTAHTKVLTGVSGVTSLALSDGTCPF